MSEPIVDPSDCPDCKAAADREHHGFKAQCLGCRARGAARTPHYRRARESGMQDRPYRSLLQQFELTHDQVRAAAAADFMLRSTKGWTGHIPKPAPSPDAPPASSPAPESEGELQ
jgi:hypothetical protein